MKPRVKERSIIIFSKGKCINDVTQKDLCKGEGKIVILGKRGRAYLD